MLRKALLFAFVSATVLTRAEVLAQAEVPTRVQTVKPVPTDPAKVSANQGVDNLGIEARLKPKSRVVRAGQKLEFELVVTANRPSQVEGTVLAGMDIATSVAGVPGLSFQEGLIRDKILMGAGARIERKFEIDLAKLAPAIEPRDGKLVPITISWPGLPGAEATIDVAPDASKVPLEAMDLDKTRVMLITNFGTMTVKFFPGKAPGHAQNFIKLAQQGFYDGTRFHRVIKGFMIQGGCPNTKDGATGEPGAGDPGYRIAAEFNDVRHVRGILSMARSQDPNSAGCQFFVMHGEAPPLDGKYTAFGQLETGLDTLDKIVDVPVKESRAGEISAPAEPVHLLAAVVLPVLKAPK